MSDVPTPFSPDSDPTEVFHRLGRLVVGDLPLDEIMDRIVVMTKEVIPAASEVSVTLMRDGQSRTAAFTGETAMKLDEAQYAAGYGPCMDAAEAGGVFAIHDTTAGGPDWPQFSAQAAAAGVRSTLSVGLPIQQRTIGALNIYSADPDAFDEPSRELALTFAGYAAVALANASLYQSKSDLADQLQQAMQSRAVIEQAKGMLMVQHGCDAAAAFSMLSQASQRTNRKLRDVAQGMVDGALRPR